MALILTAGPLSEPLTLAEAKAHLRLDGTHEDAYVASLVTTSRLHVETALGLALISQSWSYFLDAWPRGDIVALPLFPLMSLDAVRTYGPDGTTTSLATAGFEVDGAGTPPRIVRRRDTVVPAPLRRSNAIEIAFTAGFGDAAGDVPAPIRQALLLLVAHWFENREPTATGTIARIPATVSELLQPWRSVRL